MNQIREELGSAVAVVLSGSGEKSHTARLSRGLFAA